MIKLITNIVIITLLVFIAKQAYECKKVYEEIASRPAIETVGFYRCAGTKKNPKWCPLEVYEETNDTSIKSSY